MIINLSKCLTNKFKHVMIFMMGISNISKQIKTYNLIKMLFKLNSCLITDLFYFLITYNE